MEAQAAQVQHEPNVRETDLFKAIEELESTAIEKSRALPDGYMRTTEEARGGQVSQVLDPGPGSREGLKPTGHDDRGRYDMSGEEGEARAAKSDNDDGVSKADDEDDDQKTSKRKKSSKSAKSMADGDMRKAMDDRKSVKKAIEVSRYLEELTDAQCDAYSGLSKSVREYHEDQATFNGALRKAVVALGNELIGLSDRLNDVLDLPRAASHKSVLNKGDVHDRNFQKGGDDHLDGPSPQKIPKEQVADFLCELYEKGEIPREAVTLFETTNRMKKAVAKRVHEHFSMAAE